MFTPNAQYSKKDLYNILRVPKEKQGGNWNTGYASYKGDFFLFCNIGVPGRTGHDYDNHWDGNDLIWFAKSKTTIKQGQIKDLLGGKFNIFIFSRTKSTDKFTFEGNGIIETYKDSTPVQITFTFKSEQINRPETISEEITPEARALWEGHSQKILVNKYERNPQARKECLDHYGYSCQICHFNFEEEYGEIGKSFIHIHHIVPISEIKKSYMVNPLSDLIPLCPNCHAIVHKRKQWFTIEEVRHMRKKIKY
jgi:5-methylcytosine-specific restriction protein A